MIEKAEKDIDGKNPKEILIVPSREALEPDFFRALMAFQYGEGEESGAGFEEMNGNRPLTRLDADDPSH